MGLVQINNSFSGQNYLPYSVACLRSYIEAHAPDHTRYTFLPLIYKRMPVRDVVSQMCNADVVGFSIYVWNANISLEAARRLKQERPDVVIVFGGPQVPDKPEQFLREHRFIDIVVHNEGERTFLNLIERLPERNWVFCWDERRRVGWLLAIPRAGDRELRFTAEWQLADALSVVRSPP